MDLRVGSGRAILPGAVVALGLRIGSAGCGHASATAARSTRQRKRRALARKEAPSKRAAASAQAPLRRRGRARTTPDSRRDSWGANG